jgi:HK97 family phage prohead protease
MERNMILENSAHGLETKFQQFDGETGLKKGSEISGYASVFGSADQGGDIVQQGAYAKSLASLIQSGRTVKMLWQHDPTQPIGVWDEVREDKKGLFVKGRLLTDVQAGSEALTLIKAGAIDGLSIGYRTVEAAKNSNGQRMLHELELWEVSLVTFPMLTEALVDVADADKQLASDLTDSISCARDELLA